MKLPLLSIFMFLSLTNFASADSLLLVDKNTKTELSIESLRNQAKTEFTLFSPFRGRKVRIRGILLDTLLKQHLSRVPNSIKLIAIDNYEVIFNNWKRNHWIIVTHEDNQPLSLRQHGPLRIVEYNYNNKNPQNLRNFNDWIWMLQRIETLQ